MASRLAEQILAGQRALEREKARSRAWKAWAELLNALALLAAACGLLLLRLWLIMVLWAWVVSSAV